MTEMPWIRWLDLDTEFGSDGSFRVIQRRPKAEHLNHNGHVNAPVIYGVAEVAGAGAAVIAAGVAGTGAYTVIRSAAIQYQRPTQGGVTASAKIDGDLATHIQAELSAGHGCDVHVDVELSDTTNTTTGACQFVVTLRPHRRQAGC